MKKRNSCFIALALALAAIFLAGPSRAQAQHKGEDRDGDDKPIRYIVVIFQENVSFDHYFATYPWAANTDGTKFKAKDDTPAVNGLLSGGLIGHNPNSVQPFRLSYAQVVTCDQDHNYPDEQKAVNSGLMDKFVETVGVGAPGCLDYGKGKGLVMGYYDGNSTTAIWNYAQHFAMSDNSFGTGFGPSTPGVINLISGNTHGAAMVRGTPGGNVSGGSVTGDPRPAFDDCVPTSKSTITITGTNVGDQLNKAGLSWGWFQGGFRPSTVAANGTATCATTGTGLSGTSLDYIPHHEGFQYYQQTSNPHHLTPSSTSMIGWTDRANHQYDLIDFWAAVDSGHMPAVSYLKARGFQDGHAGYSNALDEQRFLVETINRLQKRPEWEHTVVIIAYDDSDGWYDHQMGPIVNHSFTTDDKLNGPGLCGSPDSIVDPVQQGRCGYGPRLPLLVVSPWAKRNYVSHNLSDQSSILSFVQDVFGLGRLGDGSMDARAGSLWDMFDLDEGPHTRRLFLDPATGARGDDGDK